MDLPGSKAKKKITGRVLGNPIDSIDFIEWGFEGFVLLFGFGFGVTGDCCGLRLRHPCRGGKFHALLSRF